MSKGKGTKDDELLYKTIAKLEKRDKGRFWFTVLIFSSIILAITTVLSLGFSLNQKRESDLQKAETARVKAELAKLKAEKELKEMAEEVVSVIAKQEETEYVSLSLNEQSVLEDRLSQIAVRADNILSEKNAGKSFKDTLFVWSHVGLNIRDQPDQRDSEITWGFPLGTPLHILQDAKPQSDSFPINALGGKVKLSGAFLVVENDTIRGYGYSGLLSPLPAFISAKNIDEYVKLASRNDVLIDQFGLKVNRRTKKEVTLETKNLSIQSVFLLIRNLYGFDHQIKIGDRVSGVSQTDEEWKITVGKLRVRVYKTNTGVNATVMGKGN